MARFILQRLLFIPLILVMLVVLAYGYAHVVQWDYASRYPQLYYQLKVIRQRPQSFAEAFPVYVQGLLRADLGKLRNGESIAVVLGRASVASLGLLGLALAISIPVGLGLGILAAHWQRLHPARWLTLLTTAGLAMPSFYIGSLLILLSVAYALQREGANGLPFPLAGFGWDRHLVFPMLALTVRPLVQIAQVTATTLTGELNKRYVVAARSFGHSWPRIKQRLALRNVLAPVTLTIAGSLRTLVADLILVEWLFYWPGLGRFVALALIPSSRTDMATSPYLLEPPFVTALLVMIALLFLLSDFLGATLVRVFDPRLSAALAEEVADV
ncbi:MAG: ABC transporter permease [Anaerolineae bacterium]|nr:ABC transporter permease [Anaerolineae bacterium]